MKLAIFLKSSRHFKFLFSFPCINKSFWVNNLKAKTAMSVKTSVFVICVEAIICVLLYSLHDFTSKPIFVDSFVIQ